MPPIPTDYYHMVPNLKGFLSKCMYEAGMILTDRICDVQTIFEELKVICPSFSFVVPKLLKDCFRVRHIRPHIFRSSAPYLFERGIIIPLDKISPRRISSS